jgi:hypothetical protein
MWKEKETIYMNILRDFILAILGIIIIGIVVIGGPYLMVNNIPAPDPHATIRR